MKDTEDIPFQEGDKGKVSNDLTLPEQFSLSPAVQDTHRSLVPYDPQQQYLMEIRGFKLLTREEELAWP